MRVMLGAVAVLAAVACTSCLRTTYNRCTEMPPDRECELLDGGTDAGPDAGPADAGSTDAGSTDTGPTDAGPADAGTDGG